MPYKKKAPAKKRTKKAVGGALSAAQKRMLGQVQKEMANKGAGAITKQVVDYTRKYGDQRKLAKVSTPKSKAASQTKMKQITPAQMRALRARGKTAKPKTGGIAMSKEARANIAKKRRPTGSKLGSGRPTYTRMPVKARRPAVGSSRPKTPAQRQALMKKRLEAMRQGRVVSTRPPSSRGRLTAAQKRARMVAARRRAMAAARKRRGPSRRIKRPTRRPAASSRGLSRAAMLRARRGRSPVSRRRRASGGLASRFGRPTSRTRTVNPIRAAYTGIKTAPVGGHGNKFVNMFRSSMINSKEL